MSACTPGAMLASIYCPSFLGQKPKELLKTYVSARLVGALGF